MNHSQLLSFDSTGRDRRDEDFGEISSTPNLARNVISRVISDPRLSGIVVSGANNSGRRALVESELDSIQDRPHVVRLNGSKFGTQVPLGALSFLLSRLDLGEDPSRHELVHGLGRLLDGERKASVIVVGRPELIDEQSSSLLAQLASMGKAKLIVICQQVQDLPVDLFTLFRSGKLKHRHLRRASQAESHQLMEEELGASVSALASANLRYMAAGNRGLMRKLIHCWRTDGQLRQIRGTWVLKLKDLPSGSSMRSLYALEVQELTEPERELLGTLAVGGPIALDSLRRGGHSAALDGLLARDKVEMSAGTIIRVRIQSPVLALLVASDLELVNRSSVADQLASFHPDVDVARIRAGLFILRDVHDPMAQIEIAEDFRKVGYEPENWFVDPESRIDIMIMHVRALSLVGQLPAADELVEFSKNGLLGAIKKYGPLESLDIALQELEMLSKFVRSFGNGGQVGPSLERADQELVAGGCWLSDSLRLRALSLQTASWAAQSRQVDASKLIRYVDEELRSSRLSNSSSSDLAPNVASEIEYQLLEAELVTGAWNRAMTRAQRLSEGFYDDPSLVFYGNLVRGILLALNDDHDAALRILEPSLHQLQTTGEPLFVSTIASAVSYVLARSGRQLEAASLVGVEFDDTAEVPLNFHSWVSEIFTALVFSEFNDQEKAIRRLETLIEMVSSDEQNLFRAITNAFIVRLAGASKIEAISTSVASCEDPAADALRLLVSATTAGDSAGIATALDALVKVGLSLLATGAHNEFASMLVAKDQRKVSRAISALHRQSVPEKYLDGTHKSDGANSQPAWMRELTKREAHVAILAIGGKSNQEIAKINGVSIRTIEGHLYQVYSKVQVRNRQELTALDRTSRRIAGLR